MRTEGIRVLARRDVAALLSLDECIAAVERALRLHADGASLPPGVLGAPARGGGFHVKAAGVGRYFVAKVNGNFPGNPERSGLPAIQGVVVLFDAGTGRPLAVMDSIEITILRTGAATAVAARHLAREDARVVTICGCGNQGRVQLRSLARVRRLEKAYAFDSDRARAAAYAREMSVELGIPVETVSAPRPAVRKSDVSITCTPSTAFFLRRQDVPPGAFIAAVGADSEDKQELDPQILSASRVVVDLLDQAATIGELHHALATGLMRREDVDAELADVVTGRRPGRTSAEEIIVFDSTGIALQDVAAAAVVHERAKASGRGLLIDLAS